MPEPSEECSQKGWREKICSARWRHINGNEQATKHRDAVNDARAERFDPLSEERIHCIKGKPHSAAVADIAPKISHRPMNMLLAK